MNLLKDVIVEYKEITKKIIMALINEDFDCANYLFVEREKIIEKIDEMNYTQSEFKDICNKLKIMELQEELEKILINKRTELLSKINKISVGKSASSAYSKKLYIDSMFFNKKI